MIAPVTANSHHIEPMNRILEDLNPEQGEAVVHLDGPLLILAGAGSGKTRVITHRIAWMVREAKVSPEEILAVTFTNKAAGEMRERVSRLLGTAASRIWISTFHSAGVRILREHGEAIGIPPSFVIYDDADQLSLITRLMKDRNIDATSLPPRGVRSRIDYAKSCGKGPEDMEVPLHDPLAEKTRMVYRLYQEALRASGAVDFGDLLLETVTLLRNCPTVLDYLRSRLRYIMVDEFQDTSPVQYALVRMLAGERGNLAVVGDDDQSIYGWRGADVRNILSFEADFPKAKVVRLEQNYRSTQVILDAAHAVIRRSPVRKEKRLWTESTGGDLVELLSAVDEIEEARLVAERLDSAAREGTSRREMAVLYRVNSMSRVLEDALRARRVPYQVVRGRSFYDRAEIKDMTAYLRLAVNPDSDADILRVINTPRRGLGARTIERLRAAAVAGGTSLWKAVAKGNSIDVVGAAAERRLREFRVLIEHLNHLVKENRPAHVVVEEALRGSGYVAVLEAEDTSESKDRIENLTELLAAAAQRAEAGHTLIELLDEMALMGDADQETDPDRVALMTLHAAKGLEFELAVIVGLEERTLPHSRAFAEGGWVEEPGALAEERRLCYVGFTRAKKQLVLSCARSRWMMGSRQVRAPSRFIGELPPELISGSLPDSPHQGGWNWSTGPRFRPPETRRFEQTAPVDDGELVIDYSFDQRPADEYARPRPGARVRHRSFGEGEIRQVEGSGGEARLLVCFEDVGLKKVLARYLEIL